MAWLSTKQFLVFIGVQIVGLAFIFYLMTHSATRNKTQRYGSPGLRHSQLVSKLVREWTDSKQVTIRLPGTEVKRTNPYSTYQTTTRRKPDTVVNTRTGSNQPTKRPSDTGTNFNQPVVPKIVHFAWYSTKKLTFRFHHLISVLSAYKHIQPKEIYFWYELTPRGELWKEAVRKVPIIKMKYRPHPKEIYGHALIKPEHQGDVVSTQAILKYGGIFMDLDIIALKSFDPLLQYNVTMGLESSYGLGHGVILARPNATFIKLWLEAYKDFDSNEWAATAVLVPFKIWKKNPKLVHVEEKSIHHPNWMPQERKWIYEPGLIYNWKQNYALHLWFRYYNIDHNKDDIKTLNTTLGQVFRYIYYGKSDLIYS